MKKLLGVLIISFMGLVSIPTYAQPNSPVGTWTTISDQDGRPRSIVRISERGGVYTGTVVQVFKRPGDTGLCQNCPGRFKGKPVKGLQIMWGVRQAGRNKWSGGKILDPKTGSIYSVNLSMGRGGRVLNVRGYIGLSLLGRTQTWRRR